MNYCTIQEAWGQVNHISNNFKNYDNNIEKKIEKKTIENFENSNNNIIKNKESSKHSYKYHRDSKLNCNNFFNHMKNCRQCQIKMRNEFRPKLLENFEDIIQTNRDIIVLILVGLCFIIYYYINTCVVFLY